MGIALLDGPLFTFVPVVSMSQGLVRPAIYHVAIMCRNRHAGQGS